MKITIRLRQLLVDEIETFIWKQDRKYFLSLRVVDLQYTNVGYPMLVPYYTTLFEFSGEGNSTVLTITTKKRTFLVRLRPYLQKIGVINNVIANSELDN